MHLDGRITEEVSMSPADNGDRPQASRFDLITAGHHFLLDALPFRDPESLEALAIFADAVATCRLPIPEIDAVLLRCLRILNRHIGGVLPSLVDRYVSDDSSIPRCLASFSRCVEDVLRYRGIGDDRVQAAIAVVTMEYDRPTLAPQSVADAVNSRLSTLGTAFKRQTGLALSEYIREERLQRAAALLATTHKSIKEVWVRVGYNHASNFDHDFKHRFGVTPRQHRARAHRPAVQQQPAAAIAPRVDAWRTNASNQKITVLIVDDDEATRNTISTYLVLEGYVALAVASGAAGIREGDRTCPDLILLDYRLSDMTGLDCLRIIRQRPGGARPRVALFTADWDVFKLEEEVRALDAVITSKLCDLDQIQRVVAYLSSAA
jgi:AraC-like DNA-binding protein/CheY-like chemotaxis protein